MAHKTNTSGRRSRAKPNGEVKSSDSTLEKATCDQNEQKVEHREEQSDKTPSDQPEEITGRFVGVEETDTAINFSKLHVLKTRSSSEQNLMLKTSSLRKGVKYLSSSFLYNGTEPEKTQKESDKLNNNVTKDMIPKQLEINVTVSIDTSNFQFKDDETAIAKVTTNIECEKQPQQTETTDEDCKDICELIKAVNNAHTFKKNSNVYSVFQAKTLLSERRRSLPAIPKLLGQKIAEQGNRPLSKSVDGTESSASSKDFKAKTFRTLSRGLGRLLRRHSSVNISEPDPVFKVAYMGNVLTGWAKGEGCVDKPLATLWRNYNQPSKPDVMMKLSITCSGLKGFTKEHGLTEYWAHRITYCCSPPEYPKVFCWVYRHEGRKLKHELRCHAVLCSKESVAKKIATDLQLKIKQALFEFKRDKISRQNARLSLANSVYENPSMPRRKILLSVGGNNYKPPLERSKSAPKLMAIEEMCSEEDEEDNTAGEKSTNTWTKESSLKATYKPDEFYNTCGWRRADKKRSRKISLPAKLKSDSALVQRIESSDRDVVSEEETIQENVDESAIKYDKSISGNENSNTESTLHCDEQYSSQHISNSDNHVSFSFSNTSENSEPNSELKYTDIHTDTEDDVFYCETERHRITSDQNHHSTNESKIAIDQLCSQTNFLVLDSDEGSISSGCETASTVTSSDIEMTSLPCNFNQNEYKKDTELEEKVSVLERVQSFEQLFNRERNNSMRNFRSFSRRSYSYSKCNGSFLSGDNNAESSDAASSSPSDSLTYSPSIDSGPLSYGDEVNLVPLGEKQKAADVRRSYLRILTYPPSDDEMSPSSFDSRDFENQEQLGSDVCGAMEKNIMNNFESKIKKEDEKTEGDSDSACSVESGYSELIDSGQADCVIGNTVMV